MSGNCQLSSDQVVVVSYHTAAAVEGIMSCSAWTHATADCLLGEVQLVLEIALAIAVAINQVEGVTVVACEDVSMSVGESEAVVQTICLKKIT